MSINLAFLPWPFNANRWQQRMNADADRLIATLGEEAYGVAADLAWREDVGFVHTADPGHWSRVALEIGRRMAAAEAPAALPASRPVRVPPRDTAPSASA